MGCIMMTQVIGEILKETGAISGEQISAAMHVQEASGEVLGEILVNLNFVTKDEMASAIASQHNLEYVDLSSYVPGQKVLEMVDKEFAIINMVLPLKIENKNTLVVATSWPNNDEILNSLQEMTEHKIRFVVSNPDEIGKYLQLYYEQIEYPIEQKISDMIKASVEDDEFDAIAFVDTIINNAIKDGATDIHITPERNTSHIFFRIDGVLKHCYSIPSKMFSHIVLRIKVLGSLDIAQHILPQNGEFDFEFLKSNYNIRVSSVPTINGEKIALRLMPENFRLYTLENLGFESDLVKLISDDMQKTSGIILIVGPSGSGKTTTLYAMLRKIDILSRNVISVEEPVEHQLPFVNQVQINTRAKYTFDRALHHIGRQDPDVIAIGEILDEETAKLAIRNSATGHLILSTISGSSAVRAIARIKDLNVDKYLLADGLLSVVSQRLVRRLCNECKKEIEVSKEELIKYFSESREKILELSEDSVKIYEPQGCEHCKNSGYAGRIGVVELFRVDKVIRDMIEKNESSAKIQHYMNSIGGEDIRANGLKKLLDGLTSIQEIERIID